MGLENKIENDVLKVYLEKNSSENLEKSVKEEDEKLGDHGIKNAEEKRTVEYMVSYSIISDDEEKKYIGIGDSIEEAVKNVESKFPFKDTSAVKKLFKANIEYTVKKEELDEYKKKKKPTAAGPSVSGFSTKKNMFC